MVIVNTVVIVKARRPGRIRGGGGRWRPSEAAR
jgi:hypothetical protein